ncbi:MAG: T9SS type A sorting domain-containing protein [Candidatus Hatepunaea meridiana]|nr:T9SS type A sorting domain-containing protein [Candidatus Hatepunaea meridiana]
MYKFNSKPLFFLFLVLFVLFLTSESQAVWRIILNEHFDLDPQENTWPWRTPAEGGEFIWWHHNPDSWPRGELTLTGYSWGRQDLIYNNRVMFDEELHYSIWCAYCGPGGPNNPQWPDDDDYQNNQNAWAWWGPFDLTEAEAAYLSFWVIIDNEEFSFDSLSVVSVIDEDIITSNDDDFREQVGIGKTYVGHMEDWQFHQLYLDSLYVDGELTSYLGEDSVWVAFVWHSNERFIGGDGAFIDDVIVAWDDGLFDIFPSEIDFGYPAGEDSVYWTDHIQRPDDEVFLRLQYRVIGSAGYTPSFTIECYIDDELFYTEEIDSLLGSDSLRYVSITDTLWRAPINEHTIRWELDTPVDDGGEVEESREDNNVIEVLVDPGSNFPPNFEILTPDRDSVMVSINEAYPIRWTVSDPNEDDLTFCVYMFWTLDSSGWSANPEVVFDWQMVEDNAVFEAGENIIHITRPDTIGDVLFIAGVASDDEDATIILAPGSILLVSEEDVASPQPGTVLDYRLNNAYPNPFNRSTTINYNIPKAGQVQLIAYDLAGRPVAVLVDKTLSAGKHTCTWEPDGLPGGLYLLRLEAGGSSFIRKVIYMP